MFLRLSPQLIPNWFTASLMMVCCIGMSGCYVNSSTPLKDNETIYEQKKTNTSLSSVCDSLKQSMLDIDANRTTLALEQVNQNIRMCLPMMSFDQKIEILKLSEKMYKQFFDVDRNAAQQAAFVKFASEQSQYPTLVQSQLEQLHPRDQYLIRHQDQAYIELVQNESGDYIYQRSPQYLAKVFAPYLPESEQIFIDHLAQQTAEPTLSSGIIVISQDEVLQRALFWESYLRDHPKSYFKKDAQKLLQLYSEFIFYGTAQAPLSTHFQGKESIPAANLAVIEKLSLEPNSELAIKAKKYLAYLESHHSKSDDNLTKTTSEIMSEIAQSTGIQYKYIQRHANLYTHM